MRYELALIVLTVVLSLTFESKPKDSRHLRSASNSTQNKRNRQEFSPKRAEVFKIKKILKLLKLKKLLNNQGYYYYGYRTSPIYLYPSSISSVSPGALSSVSTARAPPAVGRRQGRARNGRRRRRRRRGRRRKNRRPTVFGRLRLVMQRQRFHRFYRSAVRVHRRLPHKRANRPRVGLRNANNKSRVSANSGRRAQNNSNNKSNKSQKNRNSRK